MFKLPNEVIEGIKDYKAALDDFLSNKINPARFTGIRVPWGIYSHREKKVYMVRVRIPAGEVTASQLKALAVAARNYGGGFAHITTRQDIQLHDVKIENTVKVLEYLKDFDLCPRGGGGNTVRNITACVFSGICPDEVFDVGNYAISLTEYLLRQETTYNLPRKLKIGFSGCSKDCAGCRVNDIGLLAAEKNNGKGFKVFAGGGMGAEPALGGLLEDFIPVEDFVYCICAIKNVFYKNGDRKNRHHNRLRFLIKELGFDNFKRLYTEEFRSLKDTEYLVLSESESVYPQAGSESIPEINDAEFIRFVKYSVHPQKQNGLASIELRIPRGDILSEKLEQIASLADDFTGIGFRVSQNQNIFLCNVAKSKLYEVFRKLKEALADFTCPSTLLDVICCKGAVTCNLGLCNSPALTMQVEKMIKENFPDTAMFGKLNIKINGCPNSCGQHPIGLVALYGAVRKVDARAVPFYRLLLGGRKGIENARLAKDTGILIPAKNVPVFLKEFIAGINDEIPADMDIYKYIEDRAEGLAKQVAKKYSYVPAYSENKDFYIDWGRSEEFSLQGLGPGECGAGVLDIINADLTDAKNNLESAKSRNYSIPELKKALFFSCRALLVVRGSDPKTEEAAFDDFIREFIKTGIADPGFSNLPQVYADLREELAYAERENKFVYLKGFLEHINELYKNMDPAFNFPKRSLETSKSEIKEDFILDLKGTPCPINYVKSKLFMENLKIGDIVSILLDEGEPIQNVPKSLEADGQKILKIEKLDGYYRVIARKVV